ncbi:conserved hypothetical protein [Coccidioides posadasii str. Silveira]|uniref:Uncharacterized protein n=1 Tax=Coccidioides posadasii (strain RMSCC 757 / Silveira) TaxID=443226 RepID=E9D464_COCPS|nr:conserved hypothetical protein [Coccidioides posadasii str. Silveira]
MVRSLQERAVTHEIPAPAHRVPHLRTNCCLSSYPHAVPVRLAISPDRHLDNPIDLEENIDQGNDTEPFSEGQEGPLLDGHAQRKSYSGPGDGKDSEAKPARDLERELQAQSQSRSQSRSQSHLGSAGPSPSPEATNGSGGCLGGARSDHQLVVLSLPTVPAELVANVSGDGQPNGTCGAGSSSLVAPLIKPQVLISSYIERLGDGRLEFLVWEPIWRSEDDIVRVSPEELNIGYATRGRKQERSPAAEPRRSPGLEKKQRSN